MQERKSAPLCREQRRVTLLFDNYIGADQATEDTQGGWILQNDAAAEFCINFVSELAYHYGCQSIIAGPGIDECVDTTAAGILKEHGP